MSEYYRALRARVGQELLLIPAVAAVLRDAAGRILVHRTHAGGAAFFEWPGAGAAGTE